MVDIKYPCGCRFDVSGNYDDFRDYVDEYDFDLCEDHKMYVYTETKKFYDSLKEKK